MEEILEKVRKLLINKNHEENEIAELRHDLSNLYDIVTHVKKNRKL